MVKNLKLLNERTQDGALARGERLRLSRRLQIRSHVTKLGDRAPASSSRYSLMLMPSRHAACSTDSPSASDPFRDVVRDTGYGSLGVELPTPLPTPAGKTVSSRFAFLKRAPATLGWVKSPRLDALPHECDPECDPLGASGDGKDTPTWSGRRDSNPRPPPWQGGALPLSHVRRLRHHPRHGDSELQPVAYETPVEPKPPAPLWDSGSSSTNAADTSGRATITSCAMRSPASISTGSWRSRFTTAQTTSPR